MQVADDLAADADRARAPAARDASGTAGSSCSAFALLAYVPFLLSSPRPRHRRHEAVPLPRSRPPARRARRTSGTRTSGSARCRTRSSATCSRWGRTSGSPTTSACPTGSRSASGWARSRSPPRSARAGCSACSASRRAGALAGALVYMLTPYQLAFTARISVLLLAWAGLPWLVGLTMRAVRTRRLARPGAVRAGVLTIGSVNASLARVRAHRARALARRSTRAAAAPRSRRGAARGRRASRVLTLGVSLWWIVGLRTQGTYGLPGAAAHRDACARSPPTSDPADMLRGLGNWFFYGTRPARVTRSTRRRRTRTTSRLIVASFAVPVVALALGRRSCAGATARYFVLLVVVGTVVGVGAWPYDDPSPYGALLKWFADDTAAGLALRNTPRVVPARRARARRTPRRRRRRAGAARSATWLGRAAAGRGVLVVGAFLPVWRNGYLSRRRRPRPRTFPQYWKDAVAALQREGNATRDPRDPRAPTSPPTAGATPIEPITPGLTDRPYVAREVLPSGIAAVGEPARRARPPDPGRHLRARRARGVARLVDIGTVALRSDLAYERFDTPRPRLLWELLTDPVPERASTPPRRVRPADAEPRRRRRAGDRRPRAAHARVDAPNPPPVALFDVRDAVPIVHTAPTDATGACSPVTARASSTPPPPGSLDGERSCSRPARSSATQLRAAARPRRRPRAHRLEPAPQPAVLRRRPRQQRLHRARRARTPSSDRVPARSVPAVERRRRAPSSSSTAAPSTPPATSRPPTGRRRRSTATRRPRGWSSGTDVVGQQARPSAPTTEQTVDHVTLAPGAGPADERSITEVTLTFDHGDPVTVALDPSSFSPAGQTISFPRRTAKVARRRPSTRSTCRRTGAQRRRVHARSASATRASARPCACPVDLAERGGAGADGHRLDVVLARLRNDPARRLDEELTPRPALRAPRRRGRSCSRAPRRIEPNAADPLIDTALGHQQESKMERRAFLKRAGAGIAATTLGAPAIAQTPQVKWRMAPSWPKSLDILRPAVALCERVSQLTEKISRSVRSPPVRSCRLCRCSMRREQDRRMRSYSVRVLYRQEPGLRLRFRCRLRAQRAPAGCLDVLRRRA